MFNESIKSSYFSILGLISKPLILFYKINYLLFRKHIKKIHIGCGPHYIQGFINIDGNFLRRTDYCFDVRAGLPFPDNSIDLIYSSHFFEHVHIYEALSILKEWHRVLSPSGYIRLTVPDFNFIFEILSGAKEYKVFPRVFQTRSGMAINYLFCDGQHKYAYTKELVEELALSVGYSKVTEAEPNLDKNISDIRLDEPEGSLYLNLYK